MSKYIYGPVPSRRLGRSLGVDLLLPKSCTVNCVYCQIGSVEPLPPIRKRFVDPAEVEFELRERVESGGKTDYITLSGSGEPTLSIDLGRIIRFAKSLDVAPVCVLTNGTFLSDRTVREELYAADVVIPNLDAADKATFDKVNRPHPDIDFDAMIEGIVQFSCEFEGKLLLEIVLLDGLNDSDEHLHKLSKLVHRIKPAGVWVGSVYRPPSEDFAKPVSPEKLDRARGIIGGSARIIESFKASDIDVHYEALIGEIEALLRRRPETVPNIAMSLGANEHEVFKAVAILITEGKVRAVKMNDKKYYEFIV